MNIAIDTSEELKTEDQRMLRNVLPLLIQQHSELHIFEMGPSHTFAHVRWIEWKQPRNFFAQLSAKRRRNRLLRDNQIELILTPGLRKESLPSLVLGSPQYNSSKEQHPAGKHFICHWQKEAIALRKNGVADPQLHLIDLPPSEVSMKPSEEEMQRVRDHYSSGNRYLLCVGGGENLRNVLKGYSIFKKRMQTQLRLLILFPKTEEAQVQQLLSTYKYRDSVSTVSQGAESKFVFPADAIIFPGSDADPLLLNAMAAGKDLLLGQELREEPSFQDAALFFDVKDPQSIASEMMKSYVGEGEKKLRERTAIKNASLRNWEDATNRFYSALRKASGRDQ